MNLFLIDAIGPFFRGYKRSTINWSKIPWDHIRLDESPEHHRQFEQIRKDFTDFCDRVGNLGYNAISLDDLAHLADHEYYEPEIREKIRICGEEFRKLFTIAHDRDLKIFITLDVISYTPQLRKHVGSGGKDVRKFLGNLIGSFFNDFPEVSGLITRIGESDGKDVRGDFKSELHLRTPGKVRRFLEHLLPICEARGKKLIFRTWTVGAYHIGDLIWHRSRFKRVFKGLKSDALIISMKYGESDFFRYLPLNANFFRSDHAKIVELQARREYEGCGEYPAYIGTDTEEFASALKGARNMVGMSVWCQTGGWVPFRRLAFLEEGNGHWTEINCSVAIRIFKHGESAQEALKHHAKKGNISSQEALTELMDLSEEAICNLLYAKEFASQKLFFRRVRIPPLLGVYWNNIFINHSTRKLARHFILDTEVAIKQTKDVLESFYRMKELAEQCGFPSEDIEFMQDTFQLLALAREYCLLPFSDEIRKRIKEHKRAYKKRWPKRQRYRIKVDYSPLRVRRKHLSWLFDLAFRKRRGYRIVDHLFTLHLLGFAYRMIVKRKPNIVPKFARESAMGIDVVFK